MLCHHILLAHVYAPNTTEAQLPGTSDGAYAMAQYYALSVGSDAEATNSRNVGLAGSALVFDCDKCPCYSAVNSTSCHAFGSVQGPVCDVAHFQLYDGTIETKENGPMFASIPDTFWWCIVTFTTVGYGDKAPRTAIGRVLGIMTMFVGIFFIAMPLTIVGASFSNAWDKIKNKADKQQQLLSDNETDQNKVDGLKMDVEAHLNRVSELIEEVQGMGGKVEPIEWVNITEKLSALNAVLESDWQRT